MPNGIRRTIFRGADGGIPTNQDAKLQDVGSVERIDRINVSNNTGKVGPNVSSFPPTGGMQFLGHIPMVHRAQGIVPIPGNSTDDRAFIPAILSGNPE